MPITSRAINVRGAAGGDDLSVSISVIGLFMLDKRSRRGGVWRSGSFGGQGGAVRER
ncbi:hypothetical protein GURASL_11450 [Geotalea uraniireducens]|uniref:Uncharacterized protein n=1 Tax=Geotalea uraniireducens TaxID=351604 RepID=A0ABM8EJN5_9BACT|nr:hypothetical protein GURASL_11450 [Geotalea uraniireducens]